MFSRRSLESSANEGLVKNVSIEHGHDHDHVHDYGCADVGTNGTDTNGTIIPPPFSNLTDVFQNHTIGILKRSKETDQPLDESVNATGINGPLAGTSHKNHSHHHCLPKPQNGTEVPPALIPTDPKNITNPAAAIPLVTN